MVHNFQNYRYSIQRSLLAIILLMVFAIWNGAFSQPRSDGCTSITVGRAASFDGSVMTSHTMDEHNARAWIDIQPERSYKAGSMMTMYRMEEFDSLAMPTYKEIPIGEIPQVDKTLGYVN